MNRPTSFKSIPAISLLLIAPLVTTKDDKDSAEATRTAAFVYLDCRDEEPDCVIRQSSDVSADYPINDRHLIIFVEGSGDSSVHFTHTARLILESEMAREMHEPILMVLLPWSQSSSVVAEHLSAANQRTGAQALQQMVIAHQRRWGEKGVCTLVGFSAGTRVVQQAFGAKGLIGKHGPIMPPERPAAMSHVTHVIFLGSSMLRGDPIPFDNITGNFVNFRYPHDTFYGDRAPFAAPAGG